jgi:cytochrome c oxidase cbb3-type subunit 3
VKTLGTVLTIVLAISAVASVSCEREERGFRVKTPDSNRINAKELSTLHAGLSAPPPPQEKNDYENNAYALSEGKRLFQQMNCSGCHAHGGGGIGPALMDDKWIYGSEPSQIFATIVEGRPNGMPSFRGKLPDYEIWQLAAYVRSLSGQAPQHAATGRDDHMQTSTPENSTKKSLPVNSAQSKSAERSQ